MLQNTTILVPNLTHRYNSVLKESQEWQSALCFFAESNLPIHPDPYKNWDTRAAYFIIVDNLKDLTGNILDAGGEIYSTILPVLKQHGFKNLLCVNLIFPRTFLHNKIIYEKGDITQTRFKSKSFAAITCLSVLEHGVNITRYFQEASRILKSGGIIITSVDYWSEPVEVGNKTSYGLPFKIFNKSEILAMIDEAQRFGLKLLAPIELDCKDRVVACDGLHYTFLYFTLVKADL